MRAIPFLFLLLLPITAFADNFSLKLASAAESLTNDPVQYDSGYYSIPFPMGDVPKNRGVCTDVIIRAYRKLDIDLQALVYQDMKNNYSLYPSQKLWGLTKPDPNIDHRRVQNLQVFFTRHGKSLPVSEKNEDYLPGDIVTWMVSGHLPHIGLVSDKKVSISGTPLIVHNIGYGQVLEDALFDYKITGHYRYGN